MSGLHLLIAAIIIVFVAAFIITMLVVNANAKKIIGTNSKLVQNQNMLVEQNKQQGREIEALQKQQEELAEKLKHAIPDKEMQLRQQIQKHREHIERTADMTDDELLAWVDLQMEEKKLYTDTDLSLKTMAKALGLTQKRLGALFKDHAKYGSLANTSMRSVSSMLVSYCESSPTGRLRLSAQRLALADVALFKPR